MAHNWNHHLLSVRDDEVGTSDLSGPQYPWSTQALSSFSEESLQGAAHRSAQIRLPSITELGLDTYLSRGRRLPQMSFAQHEIGRWINPSFFQTEFTLQPRSDIETNDICFDVEVSLAQHPREVQGPRETTTVDMIPATTTFTPQCEFSHPCLIGPSPDGVHFWKLVSHFFGRNKVSTQAFPDSVWVWFCRKHYQRAHYRVAQWPFGQCDLLLTTLRRMERWGQVQSFELCLWRREALRASGEPTAPTPRGLLESGRRHPTAYTAPVSDWLHQEVGTGKSFNDIRRVIERIRGYLAGVRQEEQGRRQA